MAHVQPYKEIEIDITSGRYKNNFIKISDFSPDKNILNITSHNHDKDTAMIFLHPNPNGSMSVIISDMENTNNTSSIAIQDVELKNGKYSIDVKLNGGEKITLEKKVPKNMWVFFDAAKVVPINGFDLPNTSTKNFSHDTYNDQIYLINGLNEVNPEFNRKNSEVSYFHNKENDTVTFFITTDSKQEYVLGHFDLGDARDVKDISSRIYYRNGENIRKPQERSYGVSNLKTFDKFEDIRLQEKMFTGLDGVIEAKNYPSFIDAAGPSKSNSIV